LQAWLFEAKVPQRTTHIGPGATFSKSVTEKRVEMEYTNRRLIWHGMFLFLIGLLTASRSSISQTHGWDLPRTWKV
jgi:hypothetical protein